MPAASVKEGRAPSALLVEDEPLLRSELRAHLERLWPELRIEAEAADGLEAARLLGASMPDLVFLDIRMPGLDGLELARLIAGRTHIVFVTAHQEFAVAAFEEGAVDFLVKPLSERRLQTTLERVRRRLHETPPPLDTLLERLRQGSQPSPIRWIQASAGNRLRITAVEDVAYFQAEAKYTKVVTEKGEMLIRRTIKDLAEGLDPERFWQVNRGTIVNVARIREVRRNGERLEIDMEGGREPLPVAHAYHHLFRQM